MTKYYLRKFDNSSTSLRFLEDIFLLSQLTHIQEEYNKRADIIVSQYLLLDTIDVHKDEISSVSILSLTQYGSYLKTLLFEPEKILPFTEGGSEELSFPEARHQKSVNASEAVRIFRREFLSEHNPDMNIDELEWIRKVRGYFTKKV